MNALKSVSSPKMLTAVWHEQKRKLKGSCFGVDRLSSRAFESELFQRIKEIEKRLSGSFEPMGLLAIPKEKPTGGHRVICVPTFSDRLIQFSVLRVLKPRLQRMGLDNSVSFGLAPGLDRSVLGARKQACKFREARPWVYKADIQKFFDTIDRTTLIKAVEQVVPHKSLIPLLTAIVGTEISDGFESGWKEIVSQAGITKGVGIRQGMPLSPLLAGAYLRGVDRQIIKSRALVVRYVDDIAAFFQSEAECRKFHTVLRDALARIGLSIGEIDEPESKTRIYRPDQPADFLGMEIVTSPNGKCRLLLSEKAMTKIETKIAELAVAERLFRKKVTLTTMGSYFQSVRMGYINAYDAAENRDELSERLETYISGAQETVLIALFGDRLDQLSTGDRKFIGID